MEIPVPKLVIMPTPPFLGSSSGSKAGLLAGDIEPRLLAEPEHFRVVMHAVEAQARAQNVEVLIVGMRQRLRQVEAGVAAGDRCWCPY